jgi:hypothetical protein
MVRYLRTTTMTMQVVFPPTRLAGVGCGAGAADILRMVANQHAIKTNFPNSQTFIMSNWTSADVAVKDAAFARLLRVICGESNECSQGVRHAAMPHRPGAEAFPTSSQPHPIGMHQTLSPLR